ncbi:MAG: prepilin-type N-terminal cleavage/methylation domain-containing protein [Candidatus Brocadiales bacterium]
MANWAVFLKDERGFTLVEVVVVVAVVGILALIVVAIATDKILTAKIVAAESDIKSLATAIASFYQDTGEFPARTVAGKNKIEVLRSSNDSSLDPEFATGLPALWGLTETDEINNHLLIDNPGGTANGYRNNNVKWNGPYIGDIGRDPWGRNYLIIARGFYDPGTAVLPIFAWIISGGPNKTIETDIKSEILNSNTALNVSTEDDDVGFLLFTSE